MSAYVPEPTEGSTLRTIYFSDTTLRDGEQAPGVRFTTDDKVYIAQQLSKLGVEEIDAGFPASSASAFETCQRIAREVGPLMEGREHIGTPMTIAVLTRTLASDVETSYQAIKDAPRASIRLFIATSDIHLEHKLRITRDQCLQRIDAAVRQARALTPLVGFGAEDAARTDPTFLCQVYQTAIDAGANTVFLSDTVGSCVPAEFYQMVKHVIDHTTYPAETTRWAIHTHNDLGLGVANALAGIEAGACMVDTTLAGIGERAGNAALEEVAMCITTHSKHYRARHDLNTRMFTSLCNLVAERGGTHMAPNKPIVGQNVFRHTSGIHQHGLLRNRLTYEYLDPDTVGATSDGLILSKLSGRSAVQARLERLNIDNLDLNPDRLNLLFAKFKALAEDRAEVSDEDLRQLVGACA
ncbi:2-isopropylmalate synthase (Alpha-isopropylmalate synthase) (Alpha-IPM synthetase) [Tieghemiomyces parasiticus]|uniref:2-isopropylmalate synthase n=1 Tax=Tieghemiomyces parasiticus TaxID=78921 RepID=A0A9W7ZXS0_9FUNG|nr:2-isopropylmalate synthase (Alpha-isopropylmalate synthase) (Alpha-IPM synthetase) [Tieghemiomyces parasiticus]